MSVANTQLHTFIDAFACARGSVDYMRIENENGKVYCSLVMGKAESERLSS